MTITQNQLRDVILRNGCYSKQKNLEIYNRFFKDSPRKFSKIFLQKYRLANKKVLDFGCNYGYMLPHFGEASKGIEVSNEHYQFGNSIGLNVVNVDIYSAEFMSQIEASSFDAVWCAGVLEHLENPHLALIRLRYCLKDNGLFFGHVPTIPNSIIFERVLKGFLYLSPYRRKLLSYESTDHINAYTTRTISYIISKAGFEIIETNIAIPQNRLFNSILNPILKHNFNWIVVVAKKIPGWNYPQKASRVLKNDHTIEYKF